MSDSGRLEHPKGSFPVAEKMARQFLALPMLPGLRPEQQNGEVEHVVALLLALTG
jgi:hypothetical protein